MNSNNPKIASTDDHVKFVSGFGSFHTNESDPQNPNKLLKPYAQVSWSQITAMVDTPDECDKHKAQWVIPSTLMSRNSTDQRQDGSFFALWADLDKNNQPIEKLGDFLRSAIFDSDFEIYTTKSATADLQRCRIIIPLEAPMTPSDWISAQCLLNNKLHAAGFEPDRAAQRLSQICNLPNKGKFYDTRSSREGKRLNPAEDWRDDLKALQAAVSLPANDDAWLVEPPPPRLVQLFNQRFPLEEILTEAGYDQKGITFKHPASESGSYSASIKDNRVHTMSSNDPLYTGGGGGGAHDAYSAFSVLMAKSDTAKAMRMAKEKLQSAGIEVPNDQLRMGQSMPNLNLTPISLDELNRAKLAPRVILPNLLYADVRMRISAGGTGKTTLAVFEAIVLSLGQELWGRTPSAPVKTVIVTHEDSRDILVARMRHIMEGMLLDHTEIAQVLANIRVLDLSGTSFRLSCIESDVVEPHAENIFTMIQRLKDFAPDWIIFDPLVSFGVGESRVNDAEQGLINAFRVFRMELDCCIEGIHHSGKANARDKTSDQYSGRGGSALADGSRMVVVMNPLDHDEWLKQTGSPLMEDESGLVMHLAKLSYCPRQPAIYVRRKGYLFSHEKVEPITTEELHRLKLEKLLCHIKNGHDIGVRYSKADLENSANQFGFTRVEMRACFMSLLDEGSVAYHSTRGKSGAYFEPKERQCVQVNNEPGEVDNNW
jgi:RecA-family ATPase